MNYKYLIISVILGLLAFFALKYLRQELKVKRIKNDGTGTSSFTLIRGWLIFGILLLSALWFLILSFE